MSTTVFYYFQGELGESLDILNAFLIPNHVIQNKSKGITFDIFTKYFPFYNKGNYHYRVQAEDSLNEYIWIDITSSDQILPYYKNNIILKILNIDEAYTLKRKTLLRRKANYQNEFNTSKQPSLNSNNSHNNSYSNNNYNSSNHTIETKPKEFTSQSQSNNTRITNEQPSLNRSSSQKVVAQETAAASQPKQQQTTSTPFANQTAKPVSTQQHNTENFLDFDDIPSSTQNNNLAFSSTIPIATITPKHGSTKNTNSNISKTNISTTTTSSSSVSPAIQLDRAELKTNLENKINDQVKKALDEKLEQDRKLVQAETDFDLAKQKHEQKLLAWSTNNKEKRNVRTLLSTMHTVLWADCRWKPIGLGDVLEPKQVKLQYRKAMLVVHPDHCVNLSNENQFISKRIFEAVNEAYNEFTKKENV